MAVDALVTQGARAAAPMVSSYFSWSIPVSAPGLWFNIKMLSYQYRKSHCGDKTVVRSSYLHNGISYTGKMSSLYWIGAQIVWVKIDYCYEQHSKIKQRNYERDDDIICKFSWKAPTNTNPSIQKIFFKVIMRWTKGVKELWMQWTMQIYCYFNCGGHCVQQASVKLYVTLHIIGYDAIDIFDCVMICIVDIYAPWENIFPVKDIVHSYSSPYVCVCVWWMGESIHAFGAKFLWSLKTQKKKKKSPIKFCSKGVHFALFFWVWLQAFKTALTTGPMRNQFLCIA